MNSKSNADILNEIKILKDSFSGKVLIAAHHYQNEDIISVADAVGDSYRLAVIVSQSKADIVVMCGVRFMAESASILARSGQTVLLPDYNAGCPMADMVSLEAAEKALASIKKMTGEDAVPLTYMNSWADLKALTGSRGGSICTSGNAKKIMAHYLDKGKKILFMPDKNLGINTSRSLGITDDEICLVSRDGSISSVGKNARIFLWDGYCPIHVEFKKNQVLALRKKYPGITLMVHPECTEDVVSLSSIAASTEGMAKEINSAPLHSVLGVGTEYRFIERMIRENPGKTIVPLEKYCCSDMDLITPQKLLEVLKACKEGSAESFHVSVSEQNALDARKALSTMIEITEGL